MIDRTIVKLDRGSERDRERTLKYMQQRWRGPIIFAWKSIKMD
jgi:hypothetical protein